MNTDQRPSVLYSLCRRGGMMLFCLLVAAVTGLSATGWADSLFLITGAEGEAAIILDPDQKDPPDLSSQMVYVSNGSRGYDITLQEGTTVTVRHEGSAVTVQSHKESVSSLISRLHIYPSSLVAPAVCMGCSSTFASSNILAPSIRPPESNWITGET